MDAKESSNSSNGNAKSLPSEASEHRLIVASTNVGKVREVRLALDDMKNWIIEPLPAGIPGVDETGTTFIENATLKATHYSRFVQELALADDSGLCVNALENRPGVYYARYGANSEAQIHRVLTELAEVGATRAADRSAVFHLAFVVARSGSVIWSTEAQLQGQISSGPAGEAGFGFDPIFFVPELRKTLAQLTTEEKNRISARGQALVELRRFLLSR